MTQINSFGRISIRKVFYDHGAVIAQVVERRLGKAEVTGSSPVNSFCNELTLIAYLHARLVKYQYNIGALVCDGRLFLWRI